MYGAYVVWNLINLTNNRQSTATTRVGYISCIFRVVVTTVKRAVIQQREAGVLARRPIQGRPHTIRREHRALLRAQLEATPDAYVLEYCVC